MPILVTSAAAFTYIAGLLVWGEEGLLWWLCSQEGQAWPLLVYRGIGLLSSRTPWVLLGGRRSHFTSLLRLPLWKPLSTPQARGAILAFRIYYRHLPETAWAAYPQCPPHTALAAPWGQGSDLPPNLPTSRSVMPGSFPTAEPRDLSQGNSQRRRLEAWSNLEGSQAWTGLGWAFLVPVGRVCCLPRVSPRAGVWSRVFGELASFLGTRGGLAGPLGLSAGPGTMSHRRGAADEPALDTQGNGRLLQGGGEPRPGSTG